MNRLDGGGEQEHHMTRTTHPATGRSSHRLALLRVAACFSLAWCAWVPSATTADEHPLSSCFWSGPISTRQSTALGEDGARFLWPEESATYWLARFKPLPVGAHLVLRREFAHARHESLNAYRTAQTPTGPQRGIPSDAIADAEITPDAGSTNPYVTGQRRDVARRSYAVRVYTQEPPADRSDRTRNSLYSGTGTTNEVALRVYVPDDPQDLLGGTALPEPELHLANGDVVRGPALCAAINDADRSLPPPLLTQAQWLGLLAGDQPPRCTASTTPAQAQPVWRRGFGAQYLFGVVMNCGAEPVPPGTPMQAAGGAYSTLHNAYLFMFTNRQFGPLMVLRGKAAQFRPSGPGVTIADASQVRYWSICTGEGLSTTETPDGGCVPDHSIPLDADGGYTVVISRAGDRPSNANGRCGVAWINWGDGGDGTRGPDGSLLHPDAGFVLMRNLLADAGFAHAIQNVKATGSAEPVLGEYYPVAQYMSRAEFEALGCPARRAARTH
jgi:hypothetical protein